MNSTRTIPKVTPVPPRPSTTPTPKKSLWKKILYGVLALILIFALFVGNKLRVQSASVDPAHLPQFIQTSFINLDHITAISKYRSGAGHDFNDGTEVCLSMKHYFAGNVATVSSDSKSKESVHPLDDGSDIPIYSPVDGTISSLEAETTPIGKQVHIIPDSAPQFTIRLFHIWETDSIHGGLPLTGIGGSHVSAGQQIGVIPATQDVDVSVEYGTIFTQRYVSYFDVMPDSLFAAYQARGLQQRSDVILSKEYRAANPLQCGGPEKDGFVYPANYNSAADYVYLSGYVAPKNSDASTGKTPATTTTPAKGNSSAVSAECAASVPAAQRPPGCAK